MFEKNDGQKKRRGAVNKNTKKRFQAWEKKFQESLTKIKEREEEVQELEDEVEDAEEISARHDEEEQFLSEVLELLKDNFPYNNYLADRPDQLKIFLEKCRELYMEYVNI